MSTATNVCQPLRNGSWSSGGAGAFQVNFADPGGTVSSFVSWALEYVSPLNDWVNQLAGNRSEVSSFASTWRGVATNLDGYENDLARSAALIDELEGRAARALRKRHDEMCATLTDASEWSSATAAALELASTIVDAVHAAVVGALSQLAGLVTTLFGFTLNPFDKIDQLRQLSNRAMDYIERVADLIERMFDAFEKLIDLLRSLIPLIQEGLQHLRETLGQLLQNFALPVGLLLGGPVGGVLGGLLGGAGADLLAGDLRVTELDPDDLTGDQRKAWEDANGVTEINSYSDLIRANGYVDSMGESDRTVVDIMEVVDENGETHWVVALPSTQDWGLLKGMFGDEFVDTLKDYPATNDLDSNIALMLMDNPHLATQYERAVLQSMSDAGIPPNANVVYTGFSQGGIMAANLASDPNTGYNTIGVVTNGSPIGGFAIPSSVQVMSFEHEGDLVAQALDGQPVDLRAVVSPTRNVVVMPAPNGDTSIMNVHDNANYTRSVETWEQSQTSTGEPSFFSGTIVNHQQHTWGE